MGSYLVIGFFVSIVWIQLNRRWIIEQKVRTGRMYAGVSKGFAAFLAWPFVLFGGRMRIRE